jgi:SAM-dependent methyltransferase
VDDPDDIARREAEFHDALAAELDARELPPRSLDHLEAALLYVAGDLTGLDVLDLGCGTGDLTLEFLKRGARVTALDISPGMAELVKQRIAHFLPGKEATVFAGNAERTGLDDGSFDLILGKWILHHLDTRRATDEVHRLLRPGGRALFVENQATNPLLRFARQHIAGRFGIPLLGTQDEHPFTDAEFDLMRERFPSLRLLYPDFFFFRLFDRQVFRKRWAPVSRAALRADDLVYVHVPRLRKRSYHVIVELSKPR